MAAQQQHLRPNHHQLRIRPGNKYKVCPKRIRGKSVGGHMHKLMHIHGTTKFDVCNMS